MIICSNIMNFDIFFCSVSKEHKICNIMCLCVCVSACVCVCLCVGGSFTPCVLQITALTSKDMHLARILEVEQDSAAKRSPALLDISY